MTVPTPTYTDGDWGYDTFTENGTTYARVVAYSGAGISDGTITIPSTLGGYTVKEIGKGGSQESIFNNSAVAVRTHLGPLPNTVTKINAYAFYSSMRVYINNILPPNLETIGDYAFYNGQLCTGDLVIPDSVTAIGQYAFQGGSYSSITISKNITSIGQYAFSWCASVTSLTFRSISAPTMATACFGLNTEMPSSTTKTYPVYSPGNWAQSALTSYGTYANSKTAFSYTATPVYEHLTYNTNKIQVDSAIRDEDGVKISTNYAKKSELPNITISSSDPSGGSDGDIWIQY